METFNELINRLFFPSHRFLYGDSDFQLAVRKAESRILSVLCYYSAICYALSLINWNSFLKGDWLTQEVSYDLAYWFSYPIAGFIRPYLPNRGLLPVIISDRFILIDFSIGIGFLVWCFVIGHVCSLLDRSCEARVSKVQSYAAASKTLNRHLSAGKRLDCTSLFVPGEFLPIQNFLEAAECFSDGSPVSARELLLSGRSCSHFVNGETDLPRLELFAHCCMELDDMGWAMKIYDKIKPELNGSSSIVLSALKAVAKRQRRKGDREKWRETRKRIEQIEAFL